VCEIVCQFVYRYTNSLIGFIIPFIIFGFSLYAGAIELPKDKLPRDEDVWKTWLRSIPAGLLFGFAVSGDSIGKYCLLKIFGSAAGFQILMVISYYYRLFIARNRMKKN
jgi:hypothetical protein